jgi:hypothetical protein
MHFSTEKVHGVLVRKKSLTAEEEVVIDFERMAASHLYFQLG